MDSLRSERDDEDARERVTRLVELVHALAHERPFVVQALERTVRALVVDDRRRVISDRLRDLNPEDLATVDALVEQLQRNRSETSP